MIGLPRDETHIGHGYTLGDLYRIAVYAVGTDHWKTTFFRGDRVEAAWSALAATVCATEERPTGLELINTARAASTEVIRVYNQAYGIDQTGARRPSFERYWFMNVGSAVDEHVVDVQSLNQIWPMLTPVNRQSLLALAVHGDYEQAAESLGVKLTTFYNRVLNARLRFLALWHEGEKPSRPWGKDRRKGRATTARPDKRTATALVRRRRVIAAGGQS